MLCTRTTKETIHQRLYSLSVLMYASPALTTQLNYAAETRPPASGL